MWHTLLVILIIRSYTAYAYTNQMNLHIWHALLFVSVKSYTDYA